MNQDTHRAGPPSRAARDVERVRRQEARKGVLGGGIVIMGDELADRLFRRIQQMGAFW